jgi:zinc transport system substrate-binding protein
MNRIVAIFSIMIFFSCGKENAKKAVKKNENITVITVNYPLYYFADRIGSDLINLQYIIPAEVDPAYWNPNVEELSLYQSADIILTNGADYAKWMENVSLPSSRIVNTSASFKDELLPLKNVASHSHGPEGEHQHKGVAFTTWLDFELAIKQAEAIKDILIKKLPKEKLVLDENFNKLREDLEALDKKMHKEALQLKNINVLGSHPVYQYLSRAYNLNIESVHFEPDVYPSDEQWKELETIVDKSMENLMLWEGQPNKKIENKLRELNIDILVFNPCGNIPAERDFLDVMGGNLKRITDRVH